MAPGSSGVMTNLDKLTPEICHRLLLHHRDALVRTLGPRSTLYYLFQERVFSKEMVDDIRKKGKGNQEDTMNEVIEQLLQRGVREFEVLVKILRKLDHNLLADIMEERRLSGLIHVTEPTSRKLGYHWKRIATDYLGLGPMIPLIQDRYPEKLREQALFMLLMWEEQDGIGANPKRLIEILESCNMRAAADSADTIIGGGKKKKKKKKGKKGKKKKKAKSA
ncbi:uncharacterized protein LOC100375208 [Saccoglossus kowalevskii]|uniref:Uncharacterized protein LOC100375208 n=1 Tax=Saccoglossus kowalevskii TaxID=10224 RepID=A0ABM0GLX8_SACKO|nr:PREDICTED: uncharacterized protein LOC100375208 [Saccoglossus kowalevskii]